MKSHFYPIAVVSFMLTTAIFSEHKPHFDFDKYAIHTKHKTEGFFLSGSLEFPFSFAYNQSRHGVTSGSHLDLSGKLKLYFQYLQGKHQWIFPLLLHESYTMSPAIKNRLIKSDDLLVIENGYLYHALTWLRIAVEGRLHTSIFEGIDLHSSKRHYEILDSEEKVEKKLYAQEFRLSTPFMPLFLQENGGLLFTLIDTLYINFDAKTALNFRQTLASGQWNNKDSSDDPIVIKPLHSFYQIGPLLGISLMGKLFEEKVTYSAEIASTWPFFEYPKKPKERLISQIIIEASANIDLKLLEWLSLEYTYKAMRIPNISQALQQQHKLNLKISFEWSHHFIPLKPL